MLKAYLNLLDKAVCTVNVVNEHDVEAATDFLCRRLQKFNVPHSKADVRQTVVEQHEQPPPRQVGPKITLVL